jgi:2,3,4,5-tetrahydropyridine-2,6-dicarboxylate N-succinyltransferase
MVAAWGIGLATIAPTGAVLDTWFPDGMLGFGSELPDVELPEPPTNDPIREVRQEKVTVTITSLDEPPVSSQDAYLRLHLISHRLIPPHGLNLAGVFRVLSNVAWTNLGPCLPNQVSAVQLRARTAGLQLSIYGVDKFPRMTDYVVPSGVRIADADRVRLGAYLAEGTTVMHEGFVNFNAGTLGASMIEGRVSSGVVIGDGSDVGGGASIMGTLSGGGKQVISIGKRCLLGANSGIGISLGDDCIVEAGCYITAGSKLALPDGSTLRARELSGQNGLLFRRNSLTGSLEALPRTNRWGDLNTELHSN